MADGDEARNGGLDWAVAAGALAAAGLVLSKVIKKEPRTKAQALRAMDRADVTTREGMAKFAQAWKRLDTLQRQERGETIDEATEALQDLQVAALSPDPSSNQVRQAFDRYNAAQRKNTDSAKARAQRQGFEPPRTCPGCQGAGGYECPRCHGSKREELRNYFGQATWIPCTGCGGKGMKTCRVCGGAGTR